MKTIIATTKRTQKAEIDRIDKFTANFRKTGNSFNTHGIGVSIVSGRLDYPNARLCLLMSVIYSRGSHNRFDDRHYTKVAADILKISQKEAQALEGGFCGWWFLRESDPFYYEIGRKLLQRMKNRNLYSN